MLVVVGFFWGMFFTFIYIYESIKKKKKLENDLEKDEENRMNI